MTRSTTKTSTSSRKTTAPKKTTTASKSITRSVAASVSKSTAARSGTASAVQKTHPRIPAPSAKSARPASLELKKQELIQKVVEQSGIKKKDAKPVVEAMLDVLGDALADGRELNLQPFGKVKFNRTKETASARVIVAKIRQSKSATRASKETVAAAAE